MTGSRATICVAAAATSSASATRIAWVGHTLTHAGSSPISRRCAQKLHFSALWSSGLMKIASYGHAAMQALQPMHEDLSKSTIPSGRVNIAAVGHAATQGASSHWLQRVTWNARRACGNVPTSTLLTKVLVTDRGTSFSDLQAVVHAWQPMHLLWSITLSIRRPLADGERPCADGTSVDVMRALPAPPGSSGPARDVGATGRHHRRRHARADDGAQLLHARLHDAVDDGPPLAPTPDDATEGQPPQVLGRVGHRHVGVPGQLTDGGRPPLVQDAQDPQPRGVAEQGEPASDVLEDGGRHDGHGQDSRIRHSIGQLTD
jgi:hypothetical protein